KPKHRPACVYCNETAVRIKATYLRTDKHTRVGDRIMVLHLRVPKYHCKQCNRFFRHRFPGIPQRYSAPEPYRLEVCEEHEGVVSQKRLTTAHRIGSATNVRWYQSYVRRHVTELSGRSCPQAQEIDTNFFTRERGYATRLVVLKG